MATWGEFAGGAAGLVEVRPDRGPGAAPGPWEAVAGGAAAMAAAGERLLNAPPVGIALLATVSSAGRPRVHPFMPRVIDGRLWAFVIADSPKARDLLSRPYTMHSQPTDEDEEFWVSGRAHAVDDAATVARLAAVMEWARTDEERLFAFDVELAGWTRWLDFTKPGHRPLHERWRA